MDPLAFENFPDEMIVNICNQMDTPTLLKMSQTSKKINDICGEIAKKRLERKKEEFRTSIESMYGTNQEKTFVLRKPGFLSVIEVEADEDNDRYVTVWQKVSGSGAKNFIMPGELLIVGEGEPSEESINRLLNFLVLEDYEERELSMAEELEIMDQSDLYFLCSKSSDQKLLEYATLSPRVRTVCSGIFQERGL